jgi:propionyl-CoA synthetase
MPVSFGKVSVLYRARWAGRTHAHLTSAVDELKVTTIFTAPTTLRVLRQADPEAELMRQYNLKSLRSLCLAGERSEPSIVTYYQRLLDELGAPGVSVNDTLSDLYSTESAECVVLILLLSTVIGALRWALRSPR